jgi:hypothetical protein
MDDTPYTWLANGNYTQTKVSKLYKYDSEIESFKRKFSHSLPKYSSAEYTDELYLTNLVFNERYIFAVLKYAEERYTTYHSKLFVIDTTLSMDDYKIYDQHVIRKHTVQCSCRNNNDVEYCKECADIVTDVSTSDMGATLLKYNNARELVDVLRALEKPNRMPSFKIDDEQFDLYVARYSAYEQCVLISEKTIYMYADGHMYKHDYIFTINKTFINQNKLILHDEFQAEHVYTFSDQQPEVHPCAPCVHDDFDDDHKRFSTYGKTRIDVKGNRYRLTYIDTIPKYTLLEDVYPASCSICCVSKYMCALQTKRAGFVYLKYNVQMKCMRCDNETTFTAADDKHPHRNRCSYCGNYYCDKCSGYIPACVTCKYRSCEKCDATVTREGWCSECL